MSGIPSYNFDADLFLSELRLQCRLFNRSINRLEKAAEHWQNLEKYIDDGDKAPPLEIVADSIVCLSAMAAVRRILWPAIGASAKVESRAKALLSLLDGLSMPNVASVKVRNSWEHFDERLDEYLKICPPGSRNVEELRVCPGPLSTETTVLRRFDPDEFSVHFNDHRVPLRPCVTEMTLLSDRISAAYTILKGERLELYARITPLSRKVGSP